MGGFSIAYPRVTSFLRNHFFSSSFGDETVPCSRVTSLLFSYDSRCATRELKYSKKDMKKILYTWDAAVTEAKHLKSEQRFSEALTGYELMDALWPDNKRIAGHRELATHW